MKLSTAIRKELAQLFFVFLSFGLMVVVSYFFVSRIVGRQILANAREILDTAEVTIRSDLREAEVVLLTTELFIKREMEKGESIQEIQSYLARITNSLRPDDAHVPGFLDVYGYIHGCFISGLEWDLPEEYKPQHRIWYSVAEAAEAGGSNTTGITSPYIDADGNRIISLAKVIRDADGNSHGTIAVDIDFSVLSDYIESLHFADGSYGMLCDENLVFVTHPFDGYLNKSMHDTTIGHAKIARELRVNPRQIPVQRMRNSDGVQVVLIFRQMYNGWYLGVATPVSSFYRDVVSMAIALSGLGVAFMLVLSMILIRLSLSKEQADRENLEKSSFLARMSHEIRTPMNSILGMAEIIHRKQLSSEIQEYIEIIRQSGNNLLAIINDILDFSKIESGRLQIESRGYYIASVVNDIINMIRPRVAEKSLEFTVNVDSAIPAQLLGDDMRLRQILTNLLTNAVKYTRQGVVSLDIKMEKVDEGSLKLICSVTDSGIGIKPEDQKRLFNDFSRMDTKANQGIEGTGLGLAITRALCRAMGGDVTVFSEYGKGSIFWATVVQKFEGEVPVAQVANPEKKRVIFHDWRMRNIRSMLDAFKNLGVAADCSLNLEDFIRDIEQGDYDYVFVSSKYAMDCIFALGKRNTPLQLVIMVEPGEMLVYQEVTSILMPVYSITLANILNDVEGTSRHGTKDKISFTAPSAEILIVDDIATNLRVAKELMAPYKMNIQICMSGYEAVELVKKNRFDLVFMDHMMPDMDGLEATGLIRAIESKDGYYRFLPIIALTANALSDQRELFIRHGLNDFLAKPIDIHKLNAVLEKWLPKEKRIESERPVEESQHDNAGGFTIPGVDVELGLRNSGGTAAIYFNILQDFCKDAESELVKITDAIEKGDSKMYVTLVHALKGAARSVGAVETGEKAAWLEQAGAGGNTAALADKTAELKDNVRALVGNIRAAVARYETENRQKNENADISTLPLEVLKEALSEMDVDTVNNILLGFAGLSLDEKTKGIIAEIEHCILMFEYDKAIEKINELF